MVFHFIHKCYLASVACFSEIHNQTKFQDPILVSDASRHTILYDQHIFIILMLQEYHLCVTQRITFDTNTGTYCEIV
jgi:hypothetical protein